MNWFQKVSQTMQNTSDVNSIIQGVAEGQLDIGQSIDNLKQMIGMNGENIETVCNDISQIVLGFPFAKSATDKIMRECCPGFQIPIPDDQQMQQQQSQVDPAMQGDPMAMPMMGGQDKPMTMPSAEFG